jgi:hypothetical protein
MARQRISITQENDQWMRKLMVNNEYSSKNEIVNNLIRVAR